MRIAIVGCGKTKDPRPGALPARERYTSPLFRKSLELAERTADRVYIASAKYELLYLDDLVETYEETLDGRSRVFREAWGDRVIMQLVARHRVAQLAESAVCIYAGAHYADPLKRALRLANIPWATPLGNLTIGPRLRELNRQLGAARG
jgi:hypothetical protein